MPWKRPTLEAGEVDKRMLPKSKWEDEAQIQVVTVGLERKETLNDLNIYPDFLLDFESWFLLVWFAVRLGFIS